MIYKLKLEIQHYAHKRKFQPFILIILNISLCASTVAYVHVHMNNNLGDGSIIYLHCLRNSEEMGHQQILYN